MKKQDKQAELKMFNVERHADFDLATDQSFVMLDEMLLKFCPEINASKISILEVGCGTAAFGFRVLDKFRNVEVTGVDIAPAMIDWVNKKNVRRYAGVVGDAEDPALFSKHSFDVVVCPFVLHHFPDITLVLANIAQWITNEGVVFIVEPNGSSFVVKIFNVCRRIVECICGKAYAARFATCNETTHSVANYRHVLKKNGFDILSCSTFAKFQLSPKGLISFSRMVLHFIFDFLPSPLSGRNLIIIARKSVRTG